MVGENEPQNQPEFAFDIIKPEDLKDISKVFKLTNKDLMRLNPNTHTSPIFRSKRDAELLTQIYRRVPVLILKGKKNNDQNPWKMRFLTTFHMSQDSHLFKTEEALINEKCRFLQRKIYQKNGKRYLPLYEARMISHYDHRYASVGFSKGSTIFKSGKSLKTKNEEYKNPDFDPHPRYWVEEKEFISKIPEEYTLPWFIAFKDVTATTNERMMDCTAIPRMPAGHKLPFILSGQSSRMTCCLLANLSSFVLDYVLRQKQGGLSVSFFIVEQLPVIPPSKYPKEIIKRIVELVIKLIYTSYSMKPFAEDCDFFGDPFTRNEEERRYMRAELDAIYAILYGLSEEDLAHIMDFFEITRRKDERKYGKGNYITKRLILRKYSKLYEKYSKLIDNENIIQEPSIGM